MLGHPIILIAGVKGGVGTTTLAAGLLRAFQDRAAGVDLTLSNDLGTLLGYNALSIASATRHVGEMPQLVNAASRRSRLLFALDMEGRMYADRLPEFVRLLAARKPVVIDAGVAGAAALLLDPLLALATHILLVAVPDVRAVVRAENCVKMWQTFERKIALVENQSGEKPLLARALPIPKTEASAGLTKWIKSPAGQVVLDLAAELIPDAVPASAAGASATPAAQAQRGIIRSLFKAG